MRALIDGDILVYRAAAAAQQTVSWNVEGADHATEVELLTSWAWPDESGAIFDGLVREVLEALGAEDYVVALTSSDNFRNDVAASYKSNRRNKPKPIALGSLRSYVEATHATVVEPRLEADDVLGILATTPRYPETLEQPASPPGPGVICSTDKDLQTVPGLHFNWDKPEGVVEVSPAEADAAFLVQSLTGDATDGFGGIRGVGPVKAKRILDADEGGGTVFERWERAVVPAWLEAGRTREDALECARLARVLRWGEYDFRARSPRLWGEK